MVNLDGVGKAKGIRLNNRARMEYRDFHWDKKNDWRFRNRFRADFPWKLVGISPFAEEEIFFGFNREKVEMNWVTAGLSAKPVDHLKLKLGYRWIAIRNATDEWENRNQLVTTLALLF
jgi:opacity protein-like surface antigen